LTISLLNNKGFTLVEMMFAIMISLLGIFALLQSMDVITQHNVKNQMRDEAVKIADVRLKSMREGPFVENIVYIPYSTVHNESGTRSYVVRKSMTALSVNSRELIVNVGWAYKNISSHHEVRSIKSR